MHKPDFVIIAIDGGAAAGKSSTARALAPRFNLMHVDTGMHYRAVTHCLIEADIPPEDTEGIAHFLAHIPLATIIREHSAFIAINSLLPEATVLRSEAVNSLVSRYAAIPIVRQFLMEYQRGEATVAATHGFSGLIMEGRDIGSVIFPEATYRFFLQADLEARQERRSNEGTDTDNISTRDHLDASRKTAPLICPAGAIAINSTNLSLEQVIEQLSAYIAVSLPDKKAIL